MENKIIRFFVIIIVMLMLTACTRQENYPFINTETVVTKNQNIEITTEKVIQTQITTENDFTIGWREGNEVKYQNKFPAMVIKIDNNIEIITRNDYSEEEQNEIKEVFKILKASLDENMRIGGNIGSDTILSAEAIISQVDTTYFEQALFASKPDVLKNCKKIIRYWLFFSDDTPELEYYSVYNIEGNWTTNP